MHNFLTEDLYFTSQKNKQGENKSLSFLQKSMF